MTGETAWRRVTVAETQTLLQQPDLLVFDVRDPDSFAAGHIDAARHLSGANLEQVLMRTPKSQPVLIYCYHGNASQTYAQMFRDFGFKTIYDLIDGYEAWRAAVPSRPSSAELSPVLRSWLSEHGFPPDNIEATRDNRMTPLMHACRLGDQAMVEALLEAGASLDPLNSDGNNALWLACYGENLEVIDRLIERGIDINHQNENGATCLMYAVSTGKTAVVARLLALGADIGIKTLDDFTALDMAANLDCLNLLRAAAG
ncbi:putative thiosulfate sulfurtransferase rhodanese-like domain/ankyrin repeat domain-containing protein [Methylocaldum marinum]|uniref:Putative thiosulfate sulfurtransferase rhodanese-like domain/ankyrin repeat domain-containing protein n=1 Tax=Methylocaldum marinum TaxID=1432792 RepID=A0A250L0F4_9GAMM|nr:ankyrin repeat domain-containing protein [Methylocaldum marinum]BBA37370.1 putative thiosulfate sulfurtransferase rhodanese-like domain/ankyrin repeat domain-containing protein [Methylocaldum marinum]